METNEPKTQPESTIPVTGDQPQRQRLMPEPRSIRNTVIAGIIAATMILAAAGGYYVYLHRAQPQPQTEVITQTPEPDVTPPDNTTSATISTQGAMPTVPTAADYKVSGIIKWQAPAKIAPVKMFDLSTDAGGNKDNDQAYLVGTFTSGIYQGGDLLVINPGCECPGGIASMARVVRQGTKYIVLTKYSDPTYSDPTYVVPADPNAPAPKYKVDKDFRLSDLEFPVTVTGLQPRQTLHLEDIYPFYQPFIQDANVTKAFVDPVMGQVYTNITDPNIDLDDIYMRRNGFYLKSPDGGVVTYSLVVDFVGDDNIPKITWTGGQKNSAEYQYKHVGGCGASQFVAVMSPKELTLKDLVSAGINSKGDTVYTFKDPNHLLLKEFYDSNYYVPEGQTKMTYSTFVKSHVLFFWVDPFGRLIKFENSQFLPQAECGKPVIYLYPRQRQQVSVQLFPQGGFSYTEPAYNKGWNVIADPSGSLTDLSSNQQYPYLFWEGSGSIYDMPTKGFSVARVDVPSFLSAKLRLLGLNDKETADFKEFWEPKMQSSPYYFITFMGNETMNKIAPLAVTPKPDTIIRILMDFKPLSKPIIVSSYPIHTPERRGFTVVEWGGVLR